MFICCVATPPTLSTFLIFVIVFCVLLLMCFVECNNLIKMPPTVTIGVGGGAKAH